MKAQTRYKYLRLLFLVLIVNFFSCDDDKVEEYDVLVNYDVIVNLHEGYNLWVEDEFFGKLNVEDLDGHQFEFDIKSGDNRIELPFGFYKAIVNGFENRSFSDFDLLAIGGNSVKKKYISISIIPDYNVEILSIQSDSYGYLELLFEPDIPEDDIVTYYRYKLWGSNDEDKVDREIIELQSRPIWLSDGIGKFLIQGAYKYYCVTPEPFAGYRDNTVWGNWFEFILD